MIIRLTQIDGKLPNLALMKLAHFFRSRGDEVIFTRSIKRGLFEPEYDLVLGSQIFKFAEKLGDAFMREFPEAILGGTGTNSTETVEQFLNVSDYEQYDYTDYPDFAPSIGFTQRGCRLACKFCVVPTKEGKVKEVNSIYDVWRGEPHPKQIHLLDNDFFGQQNWQKRADEIISGEFEVCFNQGINVRLIHAEGAAALAQMKYRDDQFKTKRIYTAWDNRRDEKIFMRGIEMLTNARIKPQHILVYMLCGYWEGETMDDIFYRFNKMNDLKLLPYPMVYDQTNKELKAFQRWVIRRYYQFVSWEDYGKQSKELVPTLF